MTDLLRYGLKWNGSKDFVASVMDDGYWTPWHIATDEITRLQSENEALWETFVKVADYLGIDNEKARKIPGKPSKVFRSAILRKQAEAVEAFISEHAPLLDRYGPGPINEKDHCCEFNLLLDRERLHSEAQRLRQQADEAGR